MEYVFTLFAILAWLFFFNKRRKKGIGALAASVAVKADPKLVSQAKQLLPLLINKYLPLLDDNALFCVRDEIVTITMGGYRSETLSRILKEKYNLPDNIATPLARHASSYLMSKYKQFKYEQMGIYRYKWSHGHNGRNGCQHGFLSGKIFEYKNPPVVDTENTRANPGEVVPCTCVAIPLFD